MTTEPGKSKKQKVFLVDDHPLVREWLATLINQQDDLRVCGEASENARALELIVSSKPDIVIVDISLEHGSGIELIKDIKALDAGIFSAVLSMHDESLYAERALRAGARGYIMKRDVTKTVLLAIRCVLSGKLYLSEKIALAMAEKLAEGRPAAPLSPMEQLSDRELEVFRRLGRGLGTREIAQELGVSFKTVQSFCARIKEKLKFNNGTELLRAAIRWHEHQGLE